MTRLAVLALLSFASIAGCGGKAVIDDPLGAGGASSSSATSVSAQVSASSGTVDCNMSGCPMGQVCHAPTGVCLEACATDADPACRPGFECAACATPSCPTCDDCVPACVPTNGAIICAEHADCPPTDLCIFSMSRCGKRCGTGDPGAVCASGVCQQCITSSCPTCEDCLSACTDTMTNGG